MPRYSGYQSLERNTPRRDRSWSLSPNLFKSAHSPPPPKVDVIDIHCHILPKVDDGSKSWDMSLEMCRMAAEDGIEHIVATPHANERFQYNRQHLSSNLEYLRVLAGSTPRLSLGCDFHLSYDNIKEVLISPERYTIEDSHYLLVELSNYSIPTQINDCFTKMADVGITPVITHPERNPILQETQERVLQWIDLGCAVQVTASAVTGAWGPRVVRAAEWLLEREAVHVLATDAHDTKRRIPSLSVAREKIAKVYGDDLAKALVDDNPRAVVSDKPLPYFPNPVMKS
jgi:protein-tyrosine phosphatase